MKKKKLSFPSALTVLFIVLIFAAILTAVVPAGLYSKLAYNAQSNMFEITDSVGKITEMEPTQETLDELGVTGNLDKFLDGTISKPVAIPGTYEKVEQNPQGIFQILLAPISGVYDSIDIILFIFVLGGCIGVLNYMGAFNSAIAVLSKITKGKEYLLIILITIIIAAGGTTFGLAEETIALYPILVPVFLAAGYDVMVCIAAIYMGSSIGTMFPTINPFSVGNASNAAGISLADGMGIRFVALAIGLIITLVYILRYAKKVKADPSQSICYDQYEYHMKKFGHQGEVPKFTGRMKLTLAVFGITFAVLVWGLVTKQWWFDNMTALFPCLCNYYGLYIRNRREKFHGSVYRRRGRFNECGTRCRCCKGNQYHTRKWYGLRYNSCIFLRRHQRYEPDHLYYSDDVCIYCTWIFHLLLFRACSVVCADHGAAGRYCRSIKGGDCLSICIWTGTDFLYHPGGIDFGLPGDGRRDI